MTMRDLTPEAPQVPVPTAPAASIDLRTAPAHRAAALALNGAHVVETSDLDAAGFAMLIGAAFRAVLVPPAAALLIAFDQDARYGSPNFQWFRLRLPRFVYIDRVIVAASHRRLGLAERLYAELIQQARAAQHDRLVCEVNLDPPNPASDAFHATAGFTEMGRATLANGKTVRYLSRPLD
jgi:hypothetical protein